MADSGPSRPARVECRAMKMAREKERVGRLKSKQRRFEQLTVDTIGKALLITDTYWQGKQRAWLDTHQAAVARRPVATSARLEMVFRPSVCRAMAARDAERCGDRPQCRAWIAWASPAPEAIDCGAFPEPLRPGCRLASFDDRKPCEAATGRAAAFCADLEATLTQGARACTATAIGDDPGPCERFLLLDLATKRQVAICDAVLGDVPAARHLRQVCRAIATKKPDDCPGGSGQTDRWHEVHGLVLGASVPRLALFAAAGRRSVCTVKARVQRGNERLAELEQLVLVEPPYTTLELPLRAGINPLTAEVQVTARCVAAYPW